MQTALQYKSTLFSHLLHTRKKNIKRLFHVEHNNLIYKHIHRYSYVQAWVRPRAPCTMDAGGVPECFSTGAPFFRLPAFGGAGAARTRGRLAAIGVHNSLRER